MRRILAITLWTATAFAVVVASEETAVNEIIDPDDELLIETTPLPPHDLDDWKDWETWQPPAEIVKLAPFYKAGFDFDGLPVYIMEYGKWNYRGISSLSKDDVVIFQKYYETISRHVLKDGMANNNQGVVFICDYDGFALKNFASRESLKLALRNFIGIGRLYHVLAFGFFVNVNYSAETFMNLSRPYLGNLMDKIETYGTRSDKWKPAFFRKIPQDQLPPHYGGTYKDWKPLPLV